MSAEANRSASRVFPVAQGPVLANRSGLADVQAGALKHTERAGQQRKCIRKVMQFACAVHHAALDPTLGWGSGPRLGPQTNLQGSSSGDSISYARHG